MSSLTRKIEQGRFVPGRRRGKIRNDGIAAHDGKRHYLPSQTSIARLNRWTHNLHEHRREIARRLRQNGGAA